MIARYNLMEKQCYICDLSKPTGEFYKLSAGGFSSRCRECSRKMNGSVRRNRPRWRVGRKQERHGLTGHELYRTWLNMINRCYDINSKVYPGYGGRGITVCDRWLSSFTSFLEDVGERPTKKHQLERINNSGPYSKENCTWADRIAQSNNRRSSIKIELQGKTLSLSQWARELRIGKGVIQRRYHAGLTVEQIFSTIHFQTGRSIAEEA